jgi:hypothetical protein
MFALILHEAVSLIAHIKDKFVLCISIVFLLYLDVYRERRSASSLVASVGNRDQWKNNGSAVLNGNDG